MKKTLKVVCAACIHLACQGEEDPKVKLRDVINVCYRSLHVNKPPLEIGDIYWALRESIIHVQVLLLRTVRFLIVNDNPHKYMLHYLKSLTSWFDSSTWKKDINVAQESWVSLRDLYLSPAVLIYEPQEIAVAMVYRTLKNNKVELPLSEKLGKWWKIFVPTISIDKILEICGHLDRVYLLDKRLSHS